MATPTVQNPSFSKFAADIPLEHFESLANQELIYWWHHSRVNWAASILARFDQDPACRRVLDIGCGTGGFLHLLDKRFGFNDALGVDVSDHAIGLARRLGGRYEVVASSGFSPEHGYDLIFLMDVLEHVEDDAEFLRGIMSSLSPGARVFLSVPALPMLYSEWDKALGHHRRYTKKSLLKTATEAGAHPLLMSYGFSYLLPMGLWRRLSRRVSGNSESSFPSVPNWLNNFMISLNRLEIELGWKLPIPFGSSLFALIGRP